MRRPTVALCSAVLCFAACGDSPTSDTRIHVDGVYDTAVQLVSNTCGAVTVRSGFTAQVTVQVVRTAGPCDYLVAWTGTRRSGTNVIP